MRSPSIFFQYLASWALVIFCALSSASVLGVVSSSSGLTSTSTSTSSTSCSTGFAGGETSAVSTIESAISAFLVSFEPLLVTLLAKLMVDWPLPGPALARAPPVDLRVVGILVCGAGEGSMIAMFLVPLESAYSKTGTLVVGVMEESTRSQPWRFRCSSIARFDDVQSDPEVGGLRRW